MLKKRLLLLLFSALVLVAYLGILFFQGWKNDWQPGPKTALDLPENAKNLPKTIEDSIITIANWNLGYAGLGAESDFFYNHGKMLFSGSHMVFAPEELTKKNWRGIHDFIKNTPADCWLLQEIDREADRSHHIQEFDELASGLPGRAAFYAENYRAERVAIPVFEPWHFYGKVSSGIAAFTKWAPSEAVRFQLPGEYPLPNRLFQLDRCLQFLRFPTKWGLDLVIINIHNSAYDPGDLLKKQQLVFLHDLALSEFQKGNFVVIGGDWNQCPPFFAPSSLAPKGSDPRIPSNLPADFLPDDWQVIYDPATATNRDCREPYIKEKTAVTIIDFFLVSPNVKARSVKVRDLDFQFSDHQPVLLEVALKHNPL